MLEYTNKVKMLRFFLDSRLTWNSHIDHTTIFKQLIRNLQALKRMRFMPTGATLLDKLHFKNVIPKVTCCIGVWRNCSVPMFNELEPIWVSRLNESSKIGTAKKIKLGLNDRLLPFYLSDSKRKGILLSINRQIQNAEEIVFFT